MKTTRSLLLLLSASVLCSCMQRDPVTNDPATEMYVCVDPSSGPFTEILASILRRYGFNPSQGRAVDKQGHTNFVLEAKNRSVAIWAQNMPAEPPYEVSDIENYSSGLGVDPNEFIVSVQARAPSSRVVAKRLFEDIKAAVLRTGFTMPNEADDCTGSTLRR